MRSRSSTLLIVALLGAIEFSIAVLVDPTIQNLSARRSNPADLIHILLGSTKELLANHFIKKADIYFHAGYYPSIFHEAAQQMKTDHLHQDHHDEEAHEKAMAFLREPRDIIEKFGRYFYPTQHKHLNGQEVGEILPWLTFSAKIAPHKVETYVITAYWLRRALHRPQEAEQILREGLKANPGNPELMLELARLRWEEYKDTIRATNLLTVALESLRSQLSTNKTDKLLDLFHHAALLLSSIKEQQSEYETAIDLLQQLIDFEAALNPETVQRKIAEMRKKLADKKSSEQQDKAKDLSEIPLKK